MGFTEDHAWVAAEGETATIGITAFAAGQLGEILHLELPKSGLTIVRGEAFAVVESVKVASEVYAPVSGEVIEANAALARAPGTVNADAQGAGWLVRVRVADARELDGLMDEAAYAAFVETV